MQNEVRSRSRGVTLAQVAQRAACSVPAAAGALHNGGGTARVSEELRERVRQAAEELGYRPNYHARALRRQRARVIGLVALGTGIQHQFWGQIIVGVDWALREADYSLLILGSDLNQAVEKVEHRQLDALLVPGAMFGYRGEWLDAQDIPFVWLQAPSGSLRPSVDWSEESGLEEAAQHLVALGHREVLWAGLSREGVVQEPQRLEIFRRLASSLGLRVKDVKIEAANDLSRDFHDFFQGYLKTHVPTAIVAYNDHAAQGIYGALWEKGLRVPDDVSIVGYDDLQAPFCWPPLTTISLRLPEVGREWVRMALSALDAPDTAPPRSHVTTQLLVRASTGRAR